MPIPPPANGRIWPISRRHPSKNVYHLRHNGIKNILNKFQLGFK
jgi:hypothetical protein